MPRGQNLTLEHQRRASAAQKTKHAHLLSTWGTKGYESTAEKYGVDERGCLAFAVMGGTARMAHQCTVLAQQHSDVPHSVALYFTKKTNKVQ